MSNPRHLAVVQVRNVVLDVEIKRILSQKMAGALKLIVLLV